LRRHPWTKKTDWIRIPVPNIETALARFAVWEEDRVRLGFYPGAVGIVATGDPKQPWVVEVAARLLEKSLDEVW
jgi:hypothetical protein